tara:strand:- start:15047 stop:15706 length:660 start_codon:yes stop_codon:yes gene_type:complete
MEIYNYDAEKKEYLSTEEAQESPLEKDVYLIPANATELSPPKTKANEVAIFDEEKQKWNNCEDNRGKTVYNILDRQSSTVDYIGEIKEGFTLIEPTSIYDINFFNGKWVLNKETKLEELKDVINNEIIKLDLIEYNVNTYQTDSKSILRMRKALSLTGNIYWRDANNNKVLISNEGLKNIINIKAVSIQKLINKQFEIEKEINNMTDKQVQEYKIDIGV